MKKFPVLLSIPHGGRKIPDELSEKVCITKKDLFDDSDPFVEEIYDLKNRVEYVITTDIARACIDLNRAPDDLPPKNPDGVIKSSTCYLKSIYKNDSTPESELREKIIEKYYDKYHKKIQECIKESNLKLCLDCHSMAATAPNISPDGNKRKRPLFCISNKMGKTASNEIIEKLALCIAEAFRVDKNEVSINEPFQGGYITQTYGNNPIPWIQIEMNRDLYLKKQWFDEKTLSVHIERLNELNRKFEKTLEIFFQ